MPAATNNDQRRDNRIRQRPSHRCSLGDATRSEVIIGMQEASAASNIGFVVTAWQ
jgi:hypothetical protein